jgi:hypothetical protein
MALVVPHPRFFAAQVSSAVSFVVVQSLIQYVKALTYARIRTCAAAFAHFCPQRCIFSLYRIGNQAKADPRHGCRVFSEFHKERQLDRSGFIHHGANTCWFRGGFRLITDAADVCGDR